MPRIIVNKHGFPGVRKRSDHARRRKPYYARISTGCETFIYSKNFATAEEAASEYQRMKAEKSSPYRPGTTGQHPATSYPTSKRFDHGDSPRHQAK